MRIKQHNAKHDTHDTLVEYRFHKLRDALVEHRFHLWGWGLGLGAGAGARGLATRFQFATGYVPALASPAARELRQQQKK